MRRQRRFVLITWIGIALALAGVAYPVLQAVSRPAAAQDGTNPVGTVAESPTAQPATASPTPSPAASPVVSTDASPAVIPVGSPQASPAAIEEPLTSSPSFISGQWRIGIAFATRTDAFPLIELEARGGRDWVVVVADVTNWATGRARFDPRAFGVRFAGSEEAGGLSQNLSEAAAEKLNFDEIDFGEGVELSGDETARIVLVFRLDETGVDPFLVHDGATIPLTSLLVAPEAFSQLPELGELPELTEREVTGIVDGATLELDDQPVRLAGLDAPLPGECFAGQAQRRLERLAGDSVLVEHIPGSDTAYVWVEDSAGVRSLLNYSMLSGGSAAFLAGTPGPFATWLADGDRIAKNEVAGLWGSCTSQHGTGRNLEPATSNLAIRSDGDTRPYAVWVAWSPLIITKPNGTAWAFFSAEATEGGDAGNKKLFSSRYDPNSGNWSTARAMQGGDVQMGPSAVVDIDGVVHLVYCDRARDAVDSFSEIMYVKEDGNGGWTDPIPVAREATSGFQLSPSLAIDEEGVLHVAWQDQRAYTEQAREESPSNADIFVSDLAPGGAWTKPVLINTHYVDAVASRPQIVADGNRLVAIWSIYSIEFGLDAAVRVEWSTRPLDDPLAWSAPQPLIIGRGEGFGGRLVDLEADPTGGVVLVYGRQATDTFLFMRRLRPNAREWSDDTLLTFGDRGTFPSVTVNEEGVVYVVYNVGLGETVDVGAVAVPYRSIQPGPEVILTEDQPNTQGRPVVATDVTGKPWIIYFSEPAGGPANEVRVLRNAEVPVAVPATEDDAAP